METFGEKSAPRLVRVRRHRAFSRSLKNGASSGAGAVVSSGVYCMPQLDLIRYPLLLLRVLFLLALLPSSSTMDRIRGLGIDLNAPTSEYLPVLVSQPLENLLSIRVELFRSASLSGLATDGDALVSSNLERHQKKPATSQVSGRHHYSTPLSKKQLKSAEISAKKWQTQCRLSRVISPI